MTATRVTLTVGIADLQRAILACVPHAEKQKQGDEQSVLCRVQLAAGDSLAVCATDGRTTGHATVRIEQDSRASVDDAPFIVHLLPKQARVIANAITPITEDGELFGDARLDLDMREVTVTDVSGKYPHTSATVPVIEQEQTETLEGTEPWGFPDIAARLGEAFERAAGSTTPARAMLPRPGSLAKFETAARQYAEPLVIEQIGANPDAGWLVWCGARFRGVLDTRREQDEDVRRRASLRLAHLRQLGTLSAEDEARWQLGGGDNVLHLPAGDVEPDDFTDTPDE